MMVQETAPVPAPKSRQACSRCRSLSLSWEGEDGALPPAPASPGDEGQSSLFPAEILGTQR